LRRHTDKGLQTAQDARFYQISAATKEFSNKGKKLILQYAVKHEQNIDCGGGYIKTLPAGLDQAQFSGDSDYK
jgi:calreticulin